MPTVPGDPGRRARRVPEEGVSRRPRPQTTCPLCAGQLSVRDQGRQDQIVPAQDEDLPFVLNVEGAFRITGRGTVVMGVIEQGTLRIGDHLEMIQPGSAATVAPLRVQCLGVDPAPRVTGRDPALGYPIAILIGPDIEPDAIPAGAKLQVAGPLAGH